MKVITGLLAGILLGMFVGTKTIIAAGVPQDPAIRPSASDDANVRSHGLVRNAPSGVSDE